ncbi:MAG: ABC transporter permease [Treponema sp.]|jgi:peptide/nickel transport system permease protein|nr:ABC transporter permease [Treponema sp.]
MIFTETAQKRGDTERGIMRMMMNGEFKVGLFLSFLIIVMSLVSLFRIPYDYTRMDPERRFLPPGAGCLLGTDNFGRDVFSRIITGSRYTLILALCTVAGAAAAGTILGLFSGYSGGIRDEIIMRIMDALSSFPGILLALVLIALMDNGQFTLFVALLIMFVPSFTRVMRSGALCYKYADFILAERLLGAGHLRIIFIHILPNMVPSLLSASVLGLSNAILAESAMSYLGLGIQPPTPSWGRMLFESQNFLFTAPWCVLSPGICIMLAVLAFHYLGEGIRRGLG